jgi:hypothetical protein
MNWFNSSKNDHEASQGTTSANQPLFHSVDAAEQTSNLPIAYAIHDVEAHPAPSAPVASRVVSVKTTHIPAPQQPQPHTSSCQRVPCTVAHCPNCGVGNARTYVRTYPNCKTWLAAFLLLLVFWPLCWVPLVWDAMKQTDHFCSNCHGKVGEAQPFQDFCVKTSY